MARGLSFIRFTGLFSTVIFCAFQLSAQDFGQGNVAQSNPPPIEEFVRIDNGFLGTSAGVAIPLGSFESKDYLNFYSGYAEGGWGVNFINANQKFTKHFGAGINWSRTQYNYDLDAFLVPYELNNPQLIFEAETEDAWVVHSIIASLVLTFPSKYFDLDVKLGGGAGIVRRPAIYTEAHERTTGFLTWTWQQEASASRSIAFGAGFNGRFHVSNDIDLLFQADYHRTQAEFDVSSTYSMTFLDEEVIEQSVEFLTFSLGVGLRL